RRHGAYRQIRFQSDLGPGGWKQSGCFGPDFVHRAPGASRIAIGVTKRPTERGRHRSRGKADGKLTSLVRNIAMIFNWTAIINHLWQSTAFALFAALLAFSLRRNRSDVRYRIWLAASIKFAVPFSLLVGLGARFEWHSTAAAVPPADAAVRQISPYSFAPISYDVTLSGEFPLAQVAFAIWAIGAAMVILRWLARWHTIRRTLHSATPLALDTPIPAKSAPAAMEPGVFGIFRPVLLLPEGI